MSSRKLSTQELQEEANKIMNGESDDSDEYMPSESEHYSSSEDEDDVAVIGDLGDTSDDNEITQTEPQSKRKRTVNRPGAAFDWKFGKNYSPKVFDFDSTTSGVSNTFSLEPDAPEAQYFKLFFDKNIMDIIITETNRYAHSDKKQDQWKDTDISEMYCFLAMCITMGLVEKPSLKDYWTTNQIIETPFFRTAFTRDRFMSLLSNLHFIDNTNINPDDCLRKVRPVCDAMKTKFGDLFHPFQDICIDESLILWKGRLAFKQYIPSKRKRFGLKLFEICDVETGYLLNFIIYTGAKTELDPDDEDIGIAASIVKTLMKPYLDQNHVLFIDNWYSSPRLFQYLFKQNTGACGTVKSNRKGMPVFQEKLTRGKCETACTDNMLAVKWCDKKYVYLLTTVNTATMKSTGKVNHRTGEEVKKPECVLEYNAKMGSVDKIDMQISFVECARKSLKWYKKLFFHILDLALFNSYILYQVRAGEKPPFSKFRLNVVQQVMEDYHIPHLPRGRAVTVDNPLRLIQRHFPSPVPPTAAQKSRTQRRCHVCSMTKLRKRQRKDTRFMCAECNVALCVYPCFRNFHTLKKY